jgi:hypothetical protein
VALQFSTAVRNAIVNVIETTIGASAVLQIRSGAQAANCAAAPAGTLLAEIQLDADWLAAAAAGAAAFQTLPDSDASADNAGTAAHFELYDSTKATCHMQGTVTASGGGGDMTITNTSIALAQPVSFDSATITAPGA